MLTPKRSKDGSEKVLLKLFIRGTRGRILLIFKNDSENPRKLRVSKHLLPESNTIRTMSYTLKNPQLLQGIGKCVPHDTAAFGA